MLSLKKAAAGSGGPWSLTTMTYSGKGKSPVGGTPRYVSMAGGLQEPAENSTLPKAEDIELEFVPRSPRDRGSQQPC